MKKTLIIIVLFLLTYQATIAQKDSIFYNKKGKSQITLAAGTSWMNDRTQTQFVSDLFLNYNYFISKKVAVGILGSMEFGNTSTNTHPIYFFGTSVKYYPIKKWCKLYTELDFSASNISLMKDSAYFYSTPKIPYLKLCTGVDISFTNHLGIEPEIFITRAIKPDKNYKLIVLPKVAIYYIFKPHDKSTVNHPKEKTTSTPPTKKTKKITTDYIPKPFDKKDILIGGSLHYYGDSDAGYAYHQISFLPRIAYFPFKHVAIGLNGIYVDGFAKKTHPKIYYYVGPYCQYRLVVAKVAFFGELGASISNHAVHDSVFIKRPNTLYLPIGIGMDIKLSKQLYAEWGFISYKTFNKNLYAMNFYRIGIDYLIIPRKK